MKRKQAHLSYRETSDSALPSDVESSKEEDYVRGRAPKAARTTAIAEQAGAQPPAAVSFDASKAKAALASSEVARQGQGKGAIRAVHTRSVSKSCAPQRKDNKKCSGVSRAAGRAAEPTPRVDPGELSDQAGAFNVPSFPSPESEQRPAPDRKLTSDSGQHAALRRATRTQRGAPQVQHKQQIAATLGNITATKQALPSFRSTLASAIAQPRGGLQLSRKARGNSVAQVNAKQQQLHPLPQPQVPVTMPSTAGAAAPSDQIVAALSGCQGPPSATALMAAGKWLCDMLHQGALPSAANAM
jgi:hypothetical protein